jgi:hypothetical protein
VTAEKVEVVISAYDGWLKGAEGVALTCKCKYKLTCLNFFSFLATEHYIIRVCSPQ